MSMKKLFIIKEGYDSYEEAVEAEVSADEARREIEKHGLEWQEFLNDVGMKDLYTGQEVLDWLGY
jgi:hypothetical protein